jgi:hypothetical protein
MAAVIPPSGKTGTSGSIRKNPMNSAEPSYRVYDPDALNTMGRAFDKAVRGLSPQSKTDPNIRQNLAIIALSIVDGRWHVSKERIAPFYRIGALIPSGTDGWPVAA